MGMMVSACRFSVGKTEGNISLERARRMYEDNTKTDCEIGRVGMDRIDLAQDRDQWRALVNTVMNLPVP
jgi:hypothetical protein